MRRAWVSSEAYEAAIAVVVAARVDLGISQRELASRLNKPRSFVSKYENRERRLDILELMAIARALDADVLKLVAGIAANLPAEWRLG
ncbi:MAG: helix-turn-helix transcriptional regulator [Pseudomonadota bacterium]